MRARTRCAALAATLAAATLALAPVTALANPFTDIADSLNDWLIGTLLAPVIDGLFQAAVTLVSQVNAQTLLTSPFRSLFGSGNAIWALADGARNAVVMPIAHSLLALAMLVQLVRVSERVDGSATMPAVREVAQLAVFFTIFSWLINNSGALCEAAFDDLSAISAFLSSGTAVEAASVNSVGGNAVTDFLAIGPLLLTSVAVYAVAAVAQVLAQVMVYARAIQLYAYLMLSPIPFALMGFEGTRHMGVSFCRNFVALCLAGAVMMLVLTAFPMLVNVVAADITQATDPTDLAAFLAWPLKLATLCVLLVVSLSRSGAWARDVLGG